MSAHSSAASEDSTLASNGPGCEPSGSANKTSSAGESLPNIGPGCPSTPTSPSSEEPTSSRLTFSAEDSRARTCPSPEKEPGSTGPALVFGPSSLDSLASFDPDTSSWRTSQLCLDGDLAVFSETFPRSGMTRNGTVYRRQPLVPLTGGTASGLLPTPVARDDGKSPEAHMAMKRRMPGGERKTITSLSVLARNDFRQADGTEAWPTPTASDARKGYSTPPGSQRGRETLSGAVHSRMDSPRVDATGTTLITEDSALAATPILTTPADSTPPSREGSVDFEDAPAMWPTPTKSDGTGGPGNQGRLGGMNLRTAVAESFQTPTAAPFSHGGSGGELHKQVAPSGGPLNPQWVAWLMGFPIDWTSLPHLGTRSSRKSPNGSDTD